MWKKKEGHRYRIGINFIKTGAGHGIVLMIPLVWWTMIVGYYWGVNFNWRWHFYNNKLSFQEDVKTQIENQLRELMGERDKEIRRLGGKVAKFDCFINEEIWKK